MPTIRNILALTPPRPVAGPEPVTLETGLTVALTFESPDELVDKKSGLIFTAPVALPNFVSGHVDGATAAELTTGVDQRFELADCPEVQLDGTDFTITFWFYKFNNGARNIVSKIGAGTEFEIYTNASRKLAFAIDGTVQAQTSGNVPVSIWTFLAVRYSGGMGDMRLNANAWYGNLAGQTVPASGGTMKFGGGAVAEYADYKIDGFHLWKRALSDDEIDQMYNGGAGREYPLV